MSDRMLRVNSILREVVAEEVERMNDSRLVMVSVTGVETSPDLRTATVYVDALSLEAGDEALAALRGAYKRLQGAIGREVRMKYTPALDFQLDPAITGGARIDEILRSLAQGEEEE